MKAVGLAEVQAEYDDRREIRILLMRNVLKRVSAVKHSDSQLNGCSHRCCHGNKDC